MLDRESERATTKRQNGPDRRRRVQRGVERQSVSRDLDFVI